MMPNGVRRESVPGEQCAQVRDRMDQLLGEYTQLMDDIASDRDRPDLARRMTLLTAAFCESRAALGAHVFADVYMAGREEDIRADERAAERTAAAPGRRQASPAHGRRLRVLPAWIAGVIISIKALAKLYPIHAAGATAAAVAVAGGGIVLSTVQGPMAVNHPRSPHAAFQVYNAEPSASRIASSTPGAKNPGTAARSAGKLPASTSPFPPGVFVPPVTSPAPAATTPASSPTPAAAAGQLTLTSTQPVTAGGVSTAKVTLTANGGPVDWHVWTDNHDLTLTWANGQTVTQGHLEDAQSATFTVTISAGATVLGGEAVVHIWPCHDQVKLTWAPAPAPSPTDSAPEMPAGLPTVTPSEPGD